MAESLVRRATAADAATIANLQIQVWQQAFADSLPPEVVLADPARHATTWEQRIKGGGPVLLAVEGTEPVGFVAVSDEVDDANLLAPIGEIEVLYVLPRWGRRGHGGRLLAGAAAELRHRSATSAQWWIPQSDKATIRFLAVAGWRPDGLRRELDTGGEPIYEIRYSGTTDLFVV